jgi:gamma-glutamyltranspeptidase
MVNLVRRSCGDRDAAVAAAAALGVVAPDACGLGGDALLLVPCPDKPAVAYFGAAATSL